MSEKIFCSLEGSVHGLENHICIYLPSRVGLVFRPIIKWIYLYCLNIYFWSFFKLLKILKYS